MSSAIAPTTTSSAITASGRGIRKMSVKTDSWAESEDEDFDALNRSEPPTLRRSLMFVLPPPLPLRPSLLLPPLLQTLVSNAQRDSNSNRLSFWTSSLCCRVLETDASERCSAGVQVHS